MEVIVVSPARRIPTTTNAATSAPTKRCFLELSATSITLLLRSSLLQRLMLSITSIVDANENGSVQQQHASRTHIVATAETKQHAKETIHLRRRHSLHVPLWNINESSVSALVATKPIARGCAKGTIFA